MHNGAGRSTEIFGRARVYFVFFLYDTIVTVVAYTAALLLRFGGQLPTIYRDEFGWLLVGFPLIHIGANLAFGMYWRGWRYAGSHDAMSLAGAVGFSTCIIFVINVLLYRNDHIFPLGALPPAAVFTFLGMGIGRFRYRLFRAAQGDLTGGLRQRLLVVGAGQAGQWLARELLTTPSHGFRPICFVDDDPHKLGQRIHGLPVSGNRLAIGQLVPQYQIDVIAFAMPSATPDERRQILLQCESTSARVKVMPGLQDLLSSQPGGMLRDLTIEDLLGRPSVKFSRRWDTTALPCVLVTGASGSIGSELCRQLAIMNVERLVLLDTNESGLFDLAADLRLDPASQRVQLQTIVANVSRADRIDRVFQDIQPTHVFHAAAYKHVQLMEEYPEEAVLANVVGTFNVCSAADRYGCGQFVFISTDKAVEPSSIMGATKRLGETIVQSFAARNGRAWCAVRFGNVLGSRGSVLTVFDRQIKAGGPVTVTSSEMTRYFMSIPEAASLILEASLLAQGGDVFLLDMGARMNILEMAHRMVRQYGLRPGIDIEVLEIGLRPGEKLHEQLTELTERKGMTEHDRVFRLTKPGKVEPLAAIESRVMALQTIAQQGDAAALRRLLLREPSAQPMNWPSFEQSAAPKPVMTA